MYKFLIMLIMSSSLMAMDKMDKKEQLPREETKAEKDAKNFASMSDQDKKARMKRIDTLRAQGVTAKHYFDPWMTPKQDR